MLGRTFRYIAFAQAPHSVASAAPRLWPEHRTLCKRPRISCQLRVVTPPLCAPSDVTSIRVQTSDTIFPSQRQHQGQRMRVTHMRHALRLAGCHRATVVSPSSSPAHMPVLPLSVGMPGSGGAHMVASAGRTPVRFCATASSVYPGSLFATTDWNARRKPRCTWRARRRPLGALARGPGRVTWKCMHCHTSCTRQAPR